MPSNYLVIVRLDDGFDDVPVRLFANRISAKECAEEPKQQNTWIVIAESSTAV